VTDGKVRVGSVGDFEEGYVRGFRVNGKDIAVVRRGRRFIAFQNLCTHSAFSFDHLRLRKDGSLVCAGHFAVFDLETGEPTAGPAGGRLPLYSATVEDDEVLVVLEETPA
jgi:nitrite reductase/ring-hydroxylating ferredoxin subunit